LLRTATIRELATRGDLTGGLLTPYERLGALVSAGGLGALYADPRLEEYVPPDCDADLLGALRQPIPMERADWDVLRARNVEVVTET
jgi:hypothetical protein